MAITFSDFVNNLISSPILFGIPSSQSHALIAGVSGAAIALQGNLSGINFEE